MKCYICDATLSEVHFNSDHGDIEPCPYCLTIINETAASWLDRPSAEGDELGEDDILSAYADLILDDFSPD